MNYIFACWELK